MSFVDVEKIINGTPQKRLINGYKMMKENYNETTAQEYYQLYSNEPLSFLLENSEMIFTEPFFGCKYYKEAVNHSHCGFTELEGELEKVSTYIEEKGSMMSEDQKSMYDDLQSSLTASMEATKNTRIYASYIKEEVDPTFESKVSDAIFAYEKMDEKEDTALISLFNEAENPIVYFTYAPYVISTMEACGGNATDISNMVNSYCEQDTDAESNVDVWKSVVEKVICGNKLRQDTAYVEAVMNNPIKLNRYACEFYMESSIGDMLEQVLTKPVGADFVPASSPVSAVNNIFDDMYESSLFSESYQEEKEKADTYKGIVYEAALNIIVREYQSCDDTTAEATGYSILNNTCTLEQAFEKVNTEYQKSVGYMMEASDNDDVSDDDMDNMEKEVNDDEETAEKKPVAPKAKNIVNKVQFKAMDKEAEQKKKMSIHAQKGQEIKNAVKAVAQLPLNVINSIKEQIHAADEKDDERRKDYLTKPGFRKKAFRNMKLAIMYGTAANFKLSFIPVVAMGRHYSKMKDRRMQNELVRELNTEIKVCEEKISDANAAGDNKEKYRLIRIKDQLDAEMVRVQTNSKFI